MATEVKTSEYFYTEARSSSGSKKLVSVLQVLAILLVIFVLLYLVILLPNQVDGQSMEPNFHDKELLFTDKTINWMGPLIPALNYEYDRGDVVVFPLENRALIKRIVAKGGDTVMIKDGKLYINGKLAVEEYIPSTTPTRTPFGSQAFLREGETITVPEGEFFLMGDNRENSKDSRFADVGFVPRNKIQGRVFLRYWPLNVFGIIGRGKVQYVSE